MHFSENVGSNHYNVELTWDVYV